MQLGRPWDWSRAFHFVGDEHTRCPTLLLQERARQDKRTMETVVCSGMPNSEKENEPFPIAFSSAFASCTRAALTSSMGNRCADATDGRPTMPG